MYALRDKSGNVSNNTDEAVKIAEMFYEYLYPSNARPENRADRTNLVREVPTVTKDEVEKAVKEIKRGKAAGDDGIIGNLPKGGGDIVIGKLPKLFSECLRTLKVSLA